MARKKQDRKKTEKNKKNTNKTKKFRKLNCSPKSDDELNEFSCYSTTSIIKLKELWNKRHPDNIIDTNNPKQIWEKLKSFMSNVCDSEKCWLNQKFAENDVNHELKH